MRFLQAYKYSTRTKWGISIFDHLNCIKVGQTKGIMFFNGDLVLNWKIYRFTDYRNWYSFVCIVGITASYNYFSPTMFFNFTTTENNATMFKKVKKPI